jgi:hypothetical protein
MKKLVAISVLFALLATAVSAQDGGWSNPWKVGFSARFSTDMFYAAKADGSTKETTVNSTGTYTNTEEYGKYAKGVVHFFPHQKPLGWDIGDHSRLGVQFSNEGENYAIRFNVDVDNTENGTWVQPEPSLYTLFTQAVSLTDWGIKGTAGIFSAGIGPWSTEAAMVGTNAVWGSWIGWSNLNRFGVDRSDRGWIHSNHFRSMDLWGMPFAVGMALGDNYKFTLGYNIRTQYFSWGNMWAPAIGTPTDSKSSMNGTFMLSGSPVEMINFDLFYSVLGSDDDTYARPISGTGYTLPKAFWRNLIGAYVQVNGIENLNLSVGYTVSFNAYETGSYLDPALVLSPDIDPATKSQKVTYTAPVHSGIDLRLAYSGIENIGLKFLTNVSFASAEGKDYTTTSYTSELPLALNESTGQGTQNPTILGKGRTEGWFSWRAILQSKLGFIDGVDLEFSLGNYLTVRDRTYKDSSSLLGTTTTYDNTYKTTSNELRATVGAAFGGSMRLGIALWLGLESTVQDDVEKTTIGGTTSTVTTAGTKNVVKFGIPVYFQVSF